MRMIKSRAQKATEAAAAPEVAPTPKATLARDKKPSVRFASRGKRYSEAMRKEILGDAERTTMEDAMEKYGVSSTSIERWCRDEEREGAAAHTLTTVAAAMPEKADSEAERCAKIIAVWKEHPGFGPSQVRNMLHRKEGLKASVTTVREVMLENGYVPPRPRRKEQRGRYEAARPRELYHLDFVHFYVHKQKQCLLFIQDDFSRFIVGWTLVPAEAADPVIACFERAVEQYGKPEAVMSDRGSAFHSWRGMSRFQKLLEEYEINFFLAVEPQTNGKIEALNAAFAKEVLTQYELVDLTDAARAIGKWVEAFNHKRTHHGLGGLLVPGDRFYGLAERTLKMIEQGQGGNALDIVSPDDRGLELFRVVSHGGSPEVYLMGKKIFGA